MKLISFLLNILGYFIPKGWKVMPWIRAVHMNPQYHSNPEEFNPARWNVSWVNL
jgi:cytochrome P450